MKIVAANHADSLRRSGDWDTAETTVLESLSEELRSFYGAADQVLPLELADLARRLEGSGMGPGDHHVA
ncbi:hypothetical protein MKK69_29765 [Methylobacterium sp. J-026]|uniref:hypothetical protein n=1 Tax=Methylobacterium sp. J-026 TaxID=2836624 RepID=UPI001FBAF6F0|nr:hypothetical protein [Methylobacterium sp. J-026]MCJ2138189.1 hypothetical protein [Methylobacterium sp. J-026]